MPDLSLEQISSRMDPTAPPTDLEALGRRHRWIGSPPQGDALARELRRRHEHPDTTTHRLLSYNTFLMPGAQLALGLAGPARLALVMAQAGLFLGQSLGRVQPRRLLEELGRGHAQLDLAPPGETRFSPLLGRLDPGAHGHRTLDVMAKAGRHRRAIEIARWVAQEYDLAALSEVFTPFTRQQMLRALEASGRPHDHAAGPPRDPGVGRLDSGLFNLCLGSGRRLVRATWSPFKSQGDPLRDGDAWATKGVLLVEVDLGPGTLELYSTHLVSGNDLLASRRRVLRLAWPRLSPPQLLALRLSQVDDLLAFYRARHDPRNVAMVVGDFNLSAQDPPCLEALVGRMAAENLRDVWPHPGRRRPPPRGDTHATGGGGRSSRLEWLGPTDPRGYLDDRLPSPRPVDRIDYIFVEDPAAQHTFNLDLTRIRRRVFARKPRKPGGERFLSDHVGLETTLIASNRANDQGSPDF